MLAMKKARFRSGPDQRDSHGTFFQPRIGFKADGPQRQPASFFSPVIQTQPLPGPLQRIDRKEGAFQLEQPDILQRTVQEEGEKGHELTPVVPKGNEQSAAPIRRKMKPTSATAKGKAKTRSNDQIDISMMQQDEGPKYIAVNKIPVLKVLETPGLSYDYDLDVKKQKTPRGEAKAVYITLKTSDWGLNYQLATHEKIYEQLIAQRITVHVTIREKAGEQTRTALFTIPPPDYKPKPKSTAQLKKEYLKKLEAIQSGKITGEKAEKEQQRAMDGLEKVYQRELDLAIRQKSIPKILKAMEGPMTGAVQGEAAVKQEKQAMTALEQIIQENLDQAIKQKKVHKIMKAVEGQMTGLVQGKAAEKQKKQALEALARIYQGKLDQAIKRKDIQKIISVLQVGRLGLMQGDVAARQSTQAMEAIIRINQERLDRAIKKRDKNAIRNILIFIQSRIVVDPLLTKQEQQAQEALQHLEQRKK